PFHSRTVLNAVTLLVRLLGTSWLMILVVQKVVHLTVKRLFGVLLFRGQVMKHYLATEIAVKMRF
ncbi:hypothetical protein, partial [Stenotrophomonas maltophilia]|uniref:hypothetical protein n=1 Tax=Stenotrophomonas maltophilia TaxID=40324 RepID=UPI0019543DE1